MPAGPHDNPTATQHNRQAWNRLARAEQRFTRAAKDEEFINPLALLDGNGWLAEGIRGRQLLCLAAGGGRQGPLYAAAGAEVTVFDISPAQLELDRQVAAERQLSLRTVEGSMDDLSMFPAGRFDLVIHPVSTCYLPHLDRVFSEIARVLTDGGLYISQHKQPASLQADTESQASGVALRTPYYQQGPLPPVQGSLHREEGTWEYLHRWEVLIGGMCRAGFVIEDLTEPCHARPDAQPATFAHRSQFVAPYVRIKARRRIGELRAASSRTVWLP